MFFQAKVETIYKQLSIEYPDSFPPELEEDIPASVQATFTEGQQLSYDAYWDQIRRKKTLIGAAVREGYVKGFQEGYIKGFQESRSKVDPEGKEPIDLKTIEVLAKQALAEHLLEKGLPLYEVADLTGLSVEQIKRVQ